MSQQNPQLTTSRLIGLIAAGFVVAGLYLAQDVLIPFALAILFSFLLGPLVDRLENLRIPRVPAVLLAVGLVAALLVGFGWLVANQAVQLATNLPEYRETIKRRVRSVTSNFDNRFSRATDAIEEIQEELKDKGDGKEKSAGAGDNPKLADDANSDDGAKSNAASKSKNEDNPKANDTRPVDVRVVQSDSLFQTVGSWLQFFLSPLGMVSLVGILTLFILLEKEDLRHRAILIISRTHLPLTTKAIDEAAGRVSRYLRMQLILNCLYGVAVGILVWAVGMPNALFWAVAGAALRFIPYVGPWSTAGGVTLLSLTQFEGWTQPLILAGAFIGIELIMNNVLEPWLYGSSAGISTIGVITSAIIWTSLWGAWGLFLAMPLTVCLVVLGRHLPQLQWLAILLSDDPPVPPESRFYQRLLARDGNEAKELVDDTFHKHGLIGLYDQLLLPTLHQTENDFIAGELEPAQRLYVHRALQRAGETAETQMIDGLAEQFDHEQANDSTKVKSQQAAKPAGTAPPDAKPVFCVPAHGTADILSCRLLGDLLGSLGWTTEETADDKLSSEVLDEIDRIEPEFVLISTIAADSERHARYWCKRVRQRFPRLPLVVGSWALSEESGHSPLLLKRSQADAVVRTAAELAAWIEHRHAPPSPAPGSAAEKLEPAVANA